MRSILRRGGRRAPQGVAFPPAPQAVARFTPYGALLVRAGLVTRPAPPILPTCPYPTSAAQRAYADAQFRAAVNGSWLDGARFQYNNAAYRPATASYTGDLAAFYAEVVRDGLVESPTPYLGLWIVGGSAFYPNWLWLAFPVAPGADPYSAQSIAIACAEWQRWAPVESGQPLAQVTGGTNPGSGRPVVGPCAVWSH